MSTVDDWKPPKEGANPEAVARAMRLRALLKRLGLNQTEFADKSGIARPNVNGALRGTSMLKSAEWPAAFKKLTGASEESIRRYLLDGEISLDELLTERRTIPDQDARAFIAGVLETRGLHAYLDGAKQPVMLSELVGVLTAVRTREARFYARPDGSHDFDELFADFRRGQLKSGARPDGAKHRAQARREQQKELGGPPPKKITF